ncbi:glycosyl transferase [Pedobacter sp. BAL39]|uniref:glycosyl transferase n=1 Tax=Pedobacter sp. BAL39 TaxID=391596 RepID=UPI0012FBFB1F|nr:glycosyl transferase [Pedobacter sp. BAL39]
MMKKQSLALEPVHSESSGLPVYILTGKDFLYQTLFCIHSLRSVSTQHYRFILVDDGTFDKDFIEQANRQLPGARLVHRKEIEHYQQQRLARSQFPGLYHKRLVYPHIKKLSDIHLIPEDAWKVTIDSDQLFFQNPATLNQWIQNPTQPLHALDCKQSYGYSTTLMTDLCGSAVPDLLNVGIIGLQSSSIPWESIEKWIHELEHQEGTSYFLEQALSAMIIGDQKSTVLDRDQYIVNPTPQDIKLRRGTLHHYVDLSKEGYFKYAWKQL